MAENTDGFDRDRYREEVRKRMAGLPRETQVAIAARAAWRAVPLIFYRWSKEINTLGWWQEHGHALVTQLAVGASYEESHNSLDRSAARACADEAGVAYSLVSLHQFSSFAATPHKQPAFSRAASATFAAESASRCASSDNATETICSSVMAYFHLGGRDGFNSIMVAAEQDIEFCLQHVGPVTPLPLWCDSISEAWLDRWSQRAKSEMTNTPGAEMLHAWLVKWVEGKPPIDGMKNWFNDWWLRHTENAERTPAFHDMPAMVSADHMPTPTPEESTPYPDPTPTPEPLESPAVHWRESFVSDRQAKKLTPTAEKCKVALARFLASAETQAPLTVSIEAPWGAGKTSFMHHLRKRLEQERIPTYWFNPWKHEAGKTLWAAFALEYERQAGAQLRPRWLRWLKDHPGCVNTPLAWVLDKGLFAPWRLARRIWLNWCRLRTEELLLLGVRLVMWVAVGGLLWFAASASGSWLLEQLAKLGDGKAIPEGVAKLFPLVALVAPAWGIIKDLVTITGDPVRQDLMAMLARNPHGDGVDELHKFHDDFARLMRVYHPANAWWRRISRWLVAVWDEMVYAVRAVVWLLRTKGLGQTEVRKPVPTERKVMRRVAFFIDDLDRCEAPKAAEVLQSLHLMLDVGQLLPASAAAQGRMPEMICVLGMDREKVAAAVAAKHEKLLPLLLDSDDKGRVCRERAMSFGHEFLEKFIQLTLHLPGMMKDDLHHYLQDISGIKSKVVLQTGSAVMEFKTRASLTVTYPPGLSPEELASEGKGPPPQSLVQSEAVVSNPAVSDQVKEGLKQVEELLDDGRIVYFWGMEVAHSLSNNPRRLKQFVNLLRLRLLLAEALGILDKNTLSPTVNTLRPDKLSVQHLAKLVALDLMCPQSMGWMRKHSGKGLDDLVKQIATEHGPRSEAFNKLIIHGISEPTYIPIDPFNLAHAPLEIYFQQLAAVAPAPVAETK